MSAHHHNLPVVLAAAAAADPTDRNTHLYLAWHQLDDLMDKLKLLDYERQLLRPMNLKPLPRHYFAKSANVGEQFYVFQSLCAWLVRRTGRDFEQPQEFHDPSQTMAALQRHLAELNVSTDFATSQLMRGAGLVCVHVLDALATLALNVQQARLDGPDERQLLAADRAAAALTENGDGDGVDEADDEDEIILERMDEEHQLEMQSDDDDEDDDDDDHDGRDLGVGLDGDVLDLRPSRQVGTKSVAGKQEAANALDVESWRLELERVLPQLKVVLRADARDWRAHLEQMRTLRGSIDEMSTETKTQIARLRTDIGQATDKIASRENYLNTNLGPLIGQHRACSMEQTELRNELAAVEQEKRQLEQQSRELDDGFASAKAQMEQRGTAMSDGTPLINIKKAAQQVRDELIEMELEIAVLRHTIDQNIMKQNAMFV